MQVGPMQAPAPEPAGGGPVRFPADRWAAVREVVRAIPVTVPMSVISTGR